MRYGFSNLSNRLTFGSELRVLVNLECIELLKHTLHIRLFVLKFINLLFSDYFRDVALDILDSLFNADDIIELLDFVAHNLV